MLHAEVDEFALARDAKAVENLELGHLERWRNLVFHDLHTGLVADDLVAFLDRADTADVEANRRVELERVAARGRLGAAEHDADFHTNLVNEDHHRIRTLDVCGQLSERLRHQPGLQAHMRVAHLAFDFRFWRQGRDRVDHDDIDGAGTHQHVGNFERLLARVGLGDQQLIHINAEFLGVSRVQRMLGVDECRRPAEFLCFGDHLQRQRRLTGRFRAVDLNHTASRQATNAERDVEPDRTRRN